MLQPLHPEDKLAGVQFHHESTRGTSPGRKSTPYIVGGTIPFAACAKNFTAKASRKGQFTKAFTNGGIRLRTAKRGINKLTVSTSSMKNNESVWHIRELARAMFDVFAGKPFQKAQLIDTKQIHENIGNISQHGCDYTEKYI